MSKNTEFYKALVLKLYKVSPGRRSISELAVEFGCKVDKVRNGLNRMVEKKLIRKHPNLLDMRTSTFSIDPELNDTDIYKEFSAK